MARVRTQLLLCALELSPMVHLSETPSSLLRISGSSCLVCIWALVSLTQVRVSVPHWFLFADQEPAIFFLIPMVGEGSVLPNHQTVSQLSICPEVISWIGFSVWYSRAVSIIPWFCRISVACYCLFKSDFLLLTTISLQNCSFSLVSLPAGNTFMMADMNMNNRPAVFQIST